MSLKLCIVLKPACSHSGELIIHCSFNSTLSDVILVTFSQPWWQYLHHGTQQVPQIGYFPHPHASESQLTNRPIQTSTRCVQSWKSFQKSIVLFLNFHVNHWKKSLFVYKYQKTCAFIFQIHLPHTASLSLFSFRVNADSGCYWMEKNLSHCYILSTWFFFLPWVFPRLYSAPVQRMPTENNVPACSLPSELEVSWEKVATRHCSLLEGVLPNRLDSDENAQP